MDVWAHSAAKPRSGGRAAARHPRRTIRPGYARETLGLGMDGDAPYRSVQQGRSEVFDVAINTYDLAGNIARGWRAQEERHSRYVIDCNHPAERDLVQVFLPHGFEID